MKVKDEGSTLLSKLWNLVWHSAQIYKLAFAVHMLKLNDTEKISMAPAQGWLKCSFKLSFYFHKIGYPCYLKKNINTS